MNEPADNLSGKMERLRHRRLLTGLVIVALFAAALFVSRLPVTRRYNVEPGTIVGQVYAGPGSDGTGRLSIMICPQLEDGFHGLSGYMTVQITSNTNMSDQRMGIRKSTDAMRLRHGQQILIRPTSEAGGYRRYNELVAQEIVILDDGRLPIESHCVIPSLAP